ncbi:FMN-linked oxidoreductase [Hypoxylon trugodes]|uniref:FMN-linked oxidoreductase n=1 Tax=Hypoxylon trugodes TaxID=326681 RepID=UPI002197EE7C|nr:FMN-linked oxidoreductase [Hypoxylon trugodes]KAI1386982.1 FMN-linked oxidoreductase [Hypoxylon trugodes]
MTSHIVNKAAPNAPYFTPAQEPPAGTAVDPASAPTLFQPLKIRGLEFQNRFAVAPMCQYSSQDGHMSDWHFAHLSQLILRGVPLTFTEATSVTFNGRITPEDLGLWKDSQITGFKRVADFAHSQGQKFGVQLAHAGRKATTVAPWLKPAGCLGLTAAPENGGWGDNVWAPSAIKFTDGFPDPKEMTLDDIKALVQAFADAAKRAVTAGVDVVEIHAAHGYLLSEFFSPLSNKRTDQYGGSFENRTRVLFEVIAAVRAVIPESMPVFVRISATEWMESAGEPSWDINESIRLAKLLPAAGVDLLDVSSGGNNADQQIDFHPYYQINLAGAIREALIKAGGPRVLIGAVGLVTTAETARSIVQEGKQLATGAAVNDDVTTAPEESGTATHCDVVLVAREFLRDPNFVLRAAHQLGVEVKWPNQYHRAGWHKGQKI